MVSISKVTWLKCNISIPIILKFQKLTNQFVAVSTIVLKDFLIFQEIYRTIRSESLAELWR